MERWQLIIASVAVACAAAAAFWLVGRVLMAAWDRLPHREPFFANLLGDAGEETRREHRRLGRLLGLRLGAVLCLVPAFFIAAWLLPAAPILAWADWAWIAIAAGLLAVFGIAGWDIARLVLERRRLRHEWAAARAVSAVLNRLNLSGYRVFNAVRIEGALIDHVVVGEKGVFSINVVPRRPPRKADIAPAAELRNGKLSFGEVSEALPVGEAAKNMTLLSAALTRKVGHRVIVRSALAVPGWQCRPDGKANHLLLNESNIIMLPSWNTPDAYLMEEDVRSIDAFLSQASRISRLD